MFNAALVVMVKQLKAFISIQKEIVESWHKRLNGILASG
jgi:hypothetical protein